MSQGKNPNRVAAGLKATVHNPNVSEEAKQSATERLHDMGTDVEGAPVRSAPQNTRSKGIDIDNEDEDVLQDPQDADDIPDDEEDGSGRRAPGAASRKTASGKDEGNVIRGYKAALHNPRVGDEAKERAQDYLEEHDAA